MNQEKWGGGHMIHIAQFTFGELPCIPGERKVRKFS